MSTMNVVEAIVRTWLTSVGVDIANIAHDTLKLLRAKAIPIPTPA